MKDFVLPDGNEEEFLKRAKLFDLDLEFVYNKFVKGSGFIVEGNIKNGASSYFSRGKRAHFENKRIDYVFDLELIEKKDKFHYRNSGFNHILAKLAVEKDITVCFSFSNLLRAKDKSIVLGRMMQNARLCKKYGVKTKVASFAKHPSELRSASDLKAFANVLGIENYI